MKVVIDGKAVSAKKVRIETDNYLLNVSVCPADGTLIINKVDGVKTGNICVYPRYPNEIEIE